MKSSDWIDVRKHLPKKTRYVIVCITYPNGDRIVTDAALVKEENGEYRWYTSDGFTCEYVTHWQEIVFPKIKQSRIKKNSRE